MDIIKTVNGENFIVNINGRLDTTTAPQLEKFINENIFIIPKMEEKIIKNKNYKIIEGFLTYIPEYCPCCGCINESNKDIIKWGFRKNCKIKIPKVSNCRSLLILHKQRFFCKHCNNTFIAETSLINKNKNIWGEK